jgi:hypothetical protein
MTLSLETKQPKPPRILIYGPQGLGKSTFGSMAHNPVFIQTEDGLDAIDVPAFPLAKTFQHVEDYLDELCSQDHNFKTLVVDSLDWLEPLIWKQVLSDRPADEKGRKVLNIDDYGFGKGYVYALDIWQRYINAINYLRNEKGMTIIQTAHSQIKKFENPETDAYDRYEIKLHKGAAAKIQEHSDIVLFANYYVGVKKEEKGFGGERKRAIGSGDRILYTEERPSFLAKNRYGLPAEINFDKDGAYWQTLKQHINYYKGQNNE